MTHRSWTLLVSLVLVLTLGLLGGLATVPYVALRPGPTFDTLGVVAGKTVVDIRGTQTYPTGGHLNMTTISVVDNISLFGAMGLWASGSSALVPREEIFPPHLSQQQVEQQNQQLFQDSESTAETAALRYLGYPTQVLVDRVFPDGASSGKLAVGDRLRTVAGTAVGTSQQVVDVLAATRAGQVVQVGFQRGDGPPRQVTVRLGPGPQPSRGYLGIGLADRPDVNFDITISLSDVGGPSAGLMFALSIVDKLTPGALAGNTFVAGTGEIGPTGDVGLIGGIPFKMMRARQAGATVFLVPAGNCDEAAARAPAGLRLVRVESLAAAVRALDALRAGQQPPGCASA
ncbi:MAG TPA: PDZ domain-containing protein [Pseudonocardiaceae bacterium]|nr:PDZ domain-containing protein [Pseudonocardiaceae bacterium]